MNIAQAIISRFDRPEKRGAPRLADLLNLAPSTVYSWIDRECIPAKRQPDVLRAAKAAGVDLSPADFFPEVSQ